MVCSHVFPGDFIDHGDDDHHHHEEDDDEEKSIPTVEELTALYNNYLDNAPKDGIVTADELNAIVQNMEYVNMILTDADTDGDVTTITLDEFLVEARMSRGIVAMKESNISLTIGNTKDFVQWMCTDISKDAANDMTAANLVKNDITKAASKKIAQWYMNYLTSTA